jgi:uncharacterized protein YydD (DUF2326 family)
MFLKKLYSEPSGLFEDVIFKNGVNFIFGQKDNEADPKSSLNSIGKSTFLDLLDFCLLASPLKNHNPRLFASSSIISSYYIVLEFDIGEIQYRIKRTYSNPKSILFELIGEEQIEYDIEEAKLVLGNLIFRRAEYQGIFSPKWFRTLIGFFLKIQKFKKDQFNDPIKFNRDISDAELVIFHLYLMGLPNSLSFDNFKYLTDLKKKKPAIAELKRLITEKFSLKDFKQTTNNINKLRLEIKKLDEIISTFKLNDQYEDAEIEANEYTKQIKEKWFENFSDRKKIEAYEASFSIKEGISTTKIKNLYKEVSDNFAEYVKVTLDDALKFRKALSESRRSFLSNEILLLQNNIASREIEISKLEQRRAILFSFLSAQEAIKDLTEAFVVISEKRNELTELESIVKTYNDLVGERDEIELEIKRNQLEIMKFINSIDLKITTFYALFTEIYNAIYLSNKNESSFSLEYQKDAEKLIDIKINLPDMYGKGKNQGRTLVYDIFILLENLQQKSFPKFIVHDGIFDGIDKAHFIALYEYIEGLANGGTKIQYITTINEEGTLSEKFGKSDIIHPEIIADQSILVLTPSNKLFGKDFESVN